MKKIAAALILALLLVPVLSFASSAATERDVLDAVKTAVPANYEWLYLIQFENILNQLDLSEKQYDQILASINNIKALITDKGQSLHQYTAYDKGVILDQFKQICAVCSLTYKYDLSKSAPWHSGDVVCYIYGPDGKLLGVFDGDQDQFVKKTGAVISENAPMFISAAGASILLAGAAFVLIKNRKTAAV